MPYLALRTNLEVATEQRLPLLHALSAAAAGLLGKPERYVMVSLHDGSPMLFAGSDAPLAYLELKSIGLPQRRAAALSAALCTLVGEQLDIARDRIYIEFADADAGMWGWDGATF